MAAQSRVYPVAPSEETPIGSTNKTADDAVVDDGHEPGDVVVDAVQVFDELLRILDEALGETRIELSERGDEVPGPVPRAPTWERHVSRKAVSAPSIPKADTGREGSATRTDRAEIEGLHLLPAIVLAITLVDSVIVLVKLVCK